ncbi:MAG: hypothetical protein LDL41_19770 [Coleofasciculus sp. S288]|nr:hypothetical protein [Coleofasciculus sp. S288]
MTKSVFNQARVWGFICDRDQKGNWRILPQQKTQRWELQLAGNRWLLLIGDVPQVNLYSSEAIAFLERRRSSFKKLEAVKTFS